MEYKPMKAPQENSHGAFFYKSPQYLFGSIPKIV